MAEQDHHHHPGRDDAEKGAGLQLRELDVQKDDFLSQVSHEVRTPMTAIRAFSEILSDEEDLADADRKRFIGTIHKESLRLTKLLDEILDLSTFERGERNWETQPVDAEEALDRALGVCDALARQHGVAMTVSERATDTLVAAESNRLAQVLINLISNAIKYNDAAKPTVGIRSWIEDGDYCVEVKDNGPGIAAEDEGKIFDKFYRGRVGGGSAQAGAGLGLAISREIIARMNGRLELMGAARRGACFRITLPLIGLPVAE